MNQIEALRQLRTLAAPVIETRDAAVLLQVNLSNATTILRRLANKAMISHLSRGRWLISDKFDRLALPELISAPYPAYISLHSALFHHGMIQQIPSVLYAVTLARPRRLHTPLGTISFHRVPPHLFKGFETTSRSEAKIASREKALFDTLYLAPGRSRVFARLPEVTIPRHFRWERLNEYATLVHSSGRRAYITGRISELKSATRQKAGSTRSGN